MFTIVHIWLLVGYVECVREIAPLRIGAPIGLKLFRKVPHFQIAKAQ
jgi:hypothetical protein